jgi:hypothetical protein
MQLLLALPLALSSTPALARPGATHETVDDGMCVPDPSREGVELCLSQQLRLTRIEDGRGRVRVHARGTQVYAELEDGALLFEHELEVRSWELIQDGATEGLRYRGCTLVQTEEGGWQALRMRYVMVNGEVRLDETAPHPRCD